MYTVTSRIAAIKQPRGGYINPNQFKASNIDDGILLNENENVHPNIVGMTVDYLTRFILGADKKEAFKISLCGAVMAEGLGLKHAVNISENLLASINGLDDQSIVNACKLTTFDVWYRSTGSAFLAKNYQETNPDQETIQNIQALVKRSLVFFKKYGPITKDGFSFESPTGSRGGYTATVAAGDGDFLTADTLWDFKVSKSKPTNKHTLQLLMYWIMGQHSGQKIYKSITKLGIFNPRLNTVYLLDVNDIPVEVIKEVERDVICY